MQSLYALVDSYHNTIRLGEKNDCSVRAVSLACNIPYYKAHALLEKNGRKPRKGVQRHIIRNVIYSLDFTLTKVSVRARTVRTLERELSNGTYLIGVRGHILCYKNGKIEDWTRGRCKHIEVVYLVGEK
jgi:hypothetical protein